VIVVDGAPHEIVRTIRHEVRRDRRVRLIVKKENQGVAKALNRGFESLLRRKDIRYLTWVSSDNIYYPKFIERLRKEIRRSPSRVGLVYGNFRHVTSEGKSLLTHNLRREFRRWQRQSKEQLLDTCFIGPAFMYKRRIAAKAGKYRPELAPVDDYDYWLRLTEHCDLRYIPYELMIYRMNSAHSISAKLLKSQRQHRRWHYTFQLAKFEARKRRNIPIETTVIYPVRDASQLTIKRFETLLEQYYSNSKVIIIDLSPNGEARSGLQRISDPRVVFLSPSTALETEAIRDIVRTTKTPFTFLYNGKTLENNHLQSLATHLRSASATDISVYCVPGTYDVREKPIAEPNESQLSLLYRTSNLQNSLTNSR